ncbi:MAG: peroxiredoxin family protein [Flavobacteriales bacterium]
MKGMNKVGMILVAVVALAWGCNSTGTSGSTSTEGEGIITGTLKNGEGLLVELKTLRAGQFIKVGQTFTDDQGNFELVPIENIGYDYHQLVVDNLHSGVLIMDSTMNVHIDAEVPVQGFLRDISIEGSEPTSILSDYFNACMYHQDSIRTLTVMMQGNKDQALAQTLSQQLINQQIEADKDARAFINEVLASGKNEEATLGALEHVKTQMGWSEFEKALKATENALGGGEFHKALKKNYVANRNPQQPRTLPGGQNGGASNRNPTSMGRRPSAGTVAPDIVMNGINGEERKLSDLRGKVVLIDFWASWCGPCRRENPNVVRAYERYKDQGFEVFSVSLDSNADRWEKAIAQDGLIWENHVSDLKGWSNAAARAYGVTSIPFTLLVDRNGEVIASNLRGSRLFGQLEQLMN